MNTLSSLRTSSRSVPMLHTTPIVFVVDDDHSVREALESAWFARRAGDPRNLNPRTNSLRTHERWFRVAWYWM